MNILITGAGSSAGTPVEMYLVIFALLLVYELVYFRIADKCNIIDKHEDTSETVICLCGKLEEIIYEEVVEYSREETSRTEDIVRKQTFKEVERHLLCPTEGLYGIQIPAGAWHTIRVIEPSIIFEAKDGAFVAK